MHHPKEAVIDGVKFVLIPETLHDALLNLIQHMCKVEHDPAALSVAGIWQAHEPEIDL